MVAAGIVFGVVIGKEVFGGVGMNMLNPALTARAFVFFTYPAAISGAKVWDVGGSLAAFGEASPCHGDGYTGATPLLTGRRPRTVAARNPSRSTQMGWSWQDLALGAIPGLDG